MLLTEYDPSAHIVADFPSVDSLKRETGFNRLVSFKHLEVGRWMLAFRSDDGRWFKEIGPLDGDQGLTHEMSAPTYQGYLKKLRTAWRTPAEVTAMLGTEMKVAQGAALRASDLQRMGIRGMAQIIARDHGQKKADEYLRAAGVFEGVRIFSGGGL